jgi:phosphate transport system ATP-binding protein
MSVSATPATSVERQGESMYADPGASSWNVAATSPENASRGAGRLEAVDVSCWFSGHKVLDRVSLAMEASKVTALIGPSGCGKSTFLRALNRLHELTPGATLGGSVEFDGMDIYGPSARVTDIRLRIGMVFQRPNPFPSMSIAQNVLAGLRLSGTRVRNKDELVHECLERAGLWREAQFRLNSWAAALSGGQQQRLCIARALAVRPKVLLMDEPCSALDPISTSVIEDTIKELSRDVTIVIVTHNMQQAQRVSDNCAFFYVDGEGQPGHIVEAGPTEALFNDPRDPRTTDYVHGRFG